MADFCLCRETLVHVEPQDILDQRAPRYACMLASFDRSLHLSHDYRVPLVQLATPESKVFLESL